MFARGSFCPVVFSNLPPFPGLKLRPFGVASTCFLFDEVLLRKVPCF